MWRLALLGLSFIGCQTPESEGTAPPERLDVRLQPAFDELKAAIEEGSDEVARAILNRVRPRCQDPLSLRMFEGYERIVIGRSIRDSIQARVVIRETGGGFMVGMSLSHSADSEVAISPAYVRLEWTTWSMDSLGQQSAQLGGRVVRVPDVWRLPPGHDFEVDLGMDSPRMREGALAVRVEWRASMGAGSTVMRGERYPVQGLRVEGGVVVRLSKLLPTGPVEPDELFRYALSDSVKLPALLERAVRIQPERYEEALDLLTGMERRFSPSALEALVPVLSWLTGSTGIAGTGKEWRAWLIERQAEKEPVGILDLPDDLGR